MVFEPWARLRGGCSAVAWGPWKRQLYDRLLGQGGTVVVRLCGSFMHSCILEVVPVRGLWRAHAPAG